MAVPTPVGSFRRPAVAALLGSALFAAACGGGTGGGDGAGSAPKAVPSSQTALSTVEYRSRANSVCRSAARGAPAFPGSKSGTGYQTTASAVTPYLRAVLEINTASLARMQRLHPPAAVDAGHRRLLAAHRSRLKDLRAALDAAGHGDTRGFTAAFQRDQKQTEPRYTRAALRLGLRACAGV